MRVEDIMMKDSPTCTVHYTIQDTLEIFAKINSQIIPVVNDDKRLIGLLTKNKIIQILAEGYSFQCPITSFINFNPIFYIQIKILMRLENYCLNIKLDMLQSSIDNCILLVFYLHHKYYLHTT